MIRALSALAVLVVSSSMLAACKGEHDETHVTGEAADGLISRALLFGEVERVRARLSPDGAKVSWLAPVDGVMNIWVGLASDPDGARPVTAFTDQGPPYYDWARNSTHIIYMLPGEAPGAWRVQAVDVATSQTRDITPLDGDVKSWIQAASWDHPDEIIVAAMGLDAITESYYRVNLITGESRLAFANDEQFFNVIFDAELAPRIAETRAPDGAITRLRPNAAGEDGDGWTPIETVPAEDADAARILGLDGSNEAYYALDARGRDSVGLARIRVADGARELLGALDKADVEEVLIHPTTMEAQAIAVERLSQEWLPLTLSAAAAFGALESQLSGQISVLARTVDDRQWIVYESGPRNPGRYFVFDRDVGALDHLLDVRPALMEKNLAATSPVVIHARDGLELVSYLTLPKGADTDGDGVPEHASPLVIMLHGGPFERFRAGFDAQHQWLADRGYAALSVNVRGSYGFGKRFSAAGDGEWGDAVQDDLVDAARWAVARDVADPERIAVMGHGFGGHAAVMALERDADTFACGAALNPPLNLARFIAEVPAFWRPHLGELKRHVGDPDTQAGLADLKARSPATHPEAIRDNLLLALGSGDPRNQVDAGEDVVSKAIEAGAAATLVTFADQGAKFEGGPSAVAVMAITEHFFAGCLGGEAEPYGDDFAGADVEAPIGADFVPGLADALARKKVASND